MIPILIIFTYLIGVALGFVLCGATNYFGLENDYGTEPDKGSAYLVVLFWPVVIPLFVLFWLIVTICKFFINQGFQLRTKMQDQKNED